MKPNIKDLSHEDLEGWLRQSKEPPYRATQIRKWVFQKGVCSFSQMSDLSAGLRSALESDYSISRLTVLRRAVSRDGTVKYLYGLSDGLSIESVLIPEGRRLTLCISTQVGCGFACAFCATALLGLKRNLRASEIVDQVLEARSSLAAGQRLTHLVLMGMGEPLANYAETIKALRILSNTDWGIGISPRRITLSTVGLVPQMKRLMEEAQVNLAVSLHATTDELRSQLMPVNRKYPLAALMECCRSLPLPRRKRITFEYVMLRGVNDSSEDARRLSKLLRGMRAKINLIPFNPHPGSCYRRPERQEILRFQNELRSKGLQVNVREPRGEDILAACGQLMAASNEAVSGETAGGGQSRTVETPPASRLPAG